MTYPQDYNTTAFPAGTSIAVSRTFGIWVMVLFFVIICACGGILWARHNRSVDPLLIYVDGAHGEWRLVGLPRDRADAKRTIPYYQSVQYSLVGVFTKKWFTISTDAAANEARWGICDRETECTTLFVDTFNTSGGCDIYCMTDMAFYNKFVDTVLPMYKTYESFGDSWWLNPAKMEIHPNGEINETGGNWIVKATAHSSMNDNFDIIAYVTVARDMDDYPQTLGFYIKDFRAYRQEQ